MTDLDTLEAFLHRRIRSHGLVAASVAAAVHRGVLDVDDADRETDARTPAPAAQKRTRAANSATSLAAPVGNTAETVRRTSSGPR